MKKEEQVSKLFLQAHFGKEPEYEPLGKGKPPDFSLDQNGFEIRRLNQRHIKGGGMVEGLEQVSLSLSRAISRELSQIPFCPDTGSLFWGVRFERDLRKDIRTIARRVGREARSHYSSGSRTRQAIDAYGVVVELIPAANTYGNAFVRAYESDGDSGGLLSEIYAQSIQLALAEKIDKTKNIAARFDRWGLILVDWIMPGVRWMDELRHLVLDLQHFNTVVVINPDGSFAMDWPNGSLNQMAMA